MSIKVLIVESRYYEDISNLLLDATIEELTINKIKFEKIDVLGALEIPILIKKAILSNKYDGYIVLGCIIQGETDHHEVVKEISIKHIYEIAYKNKLPLSSAILTVKNLEQALERADIKKRNLGGKAAEVCLNLMKEI